MKKIVVIGGGTMGLDIAQVFARNGYDVVVRDIKDEIIQASEARLNKGLDKLVSKGKLDEAKKAEILSHMSFTTELAAAERLRPGTLARFGGVCLMGGLTRALVVGGRIMDELNFSVDTRATREVLATARTGARLRIADAQDCLPLRFDGGEFLGRLGTGEKPGAELVRTACEPWIERTRETWGVDGFIGWDVLAAVAAAHPEEVELLPRRVVLNRRFLEVGLLEEADPEVPEELTAPVELVHVRDGAALREHVYRTWERGLGQG